MMVVPFPDEVGVVMPWKLGNTKSAGVIAFNVELNGVTV
jgi:hypothetical protein